MRTPARVGAILAGGSLFASAAFGVISPAAGTQAGTAGATDEDDGDNRTDKDLTTSEIPRGQVRTRG